MAAELSSREREVWALLSGPLTYTEIGERLFMSPRTVESHVNALRRKLGAADRRALARMWAELRPPTGLPAELSTFVGRDAELEQIATDLEQVRLLSLVGPAGAGKTRLAVRAARRWTAATGGQCIYADLVPLPPRAGVAASVAAACQAGAIGDVVAAIAARLSGSRALLVLDNAEHVLDATARLVEELLTRCELLQVLVTSRIRLVLPFERSIVVGGLGTQVGGAAAQLFRERAGSAPLDAERVAAVCAVLGGMPLAIELAVARMGALGLDGLEAALHSQLEVLAGGARLASRHRSLEEAITWSYDLLDPADKDILTAVSVFAEPFTLVAADDVLGHPVAAGIATLCEHSLVRLESTEDGPRYRALEAIREFGSRRLSEARATEVGLRHARWALASGSPAERLAAAEWCGGRDEHVELAYQLWHALAIAYFRAGRLREAQAAHERAAALTSGRERARELTDAAAIARCRVRGEEAARLDLLAVDAALEVGARTEAAESLARIGDHAVRFAGMFALQIPRTDVQDLLDRARQLGAGDAVVAAALEVASVQDAVRGGADDPVSLARAALAHAEAAGSLPWTSGALDALCVALVETGQLADAAGVSLERADRVVTASDDPLLALEIKDALHTGALVLVGAGLLPAAMRLANLHLEMQFVRAERDLASEELFAPAALSGEWDSVLDRVDGYLAGWRQTGSPVAPGRVVGPLAVALIHRLRGDEDEHERWQLVAAAMAGDPSSIGAHADVFAAVGLLHIGDAAGAAARLRRSPAGFYGRLFGEWARALRFEAQLLSGEPLSDAGPFTNPVAGTIVARGEALRGGDRRGVLRTADDFERLGCPYQVHRSAVLAERC